MTTFFMLLMIRMEMIVVMMMMMKMMRQMKMVRKMSGDHKSQLPLLSFGFFTVQLQEARSNLQKVVDSNQAPTTSQSDSCLSIFVHVCMCMCTCFFMCLFGGVCANQPSARSRRKQLQLVTKHAET
jgi:hypothetical protein